MRAGELAEYDVEQSNRRGVLFASGLIVGESLIGVIIAVIIVLSVTTGGGESPLELVGPDFESTAQWLGLLAFIRWSLPCSSCCTLTNSIKKKL